MNTKSNFISLSITEDKYNGITIDGSSLTYDIDLFKKALLEIIAQNKTKNLLWIKIPICNSNFIPLLTSYDFVFHHCNEKDITLVKRISINPIIPTAKNHTLGVGAVVIKDNQLLVIKDKFQKGFKLPGGHIDDRENITTALKREVLEETGIKIQFENITSIGHFSPSQFGESNLYIVCKAKAVSYEINIQDADEILEAKWINLEEFFIDEEILSYNKALVKSAIVNKGLKIDECNFFTNPNKTYEFFF